MDISLKQIILTEMNESSDDTKTDHTDRKRESINHCKNFTNIFNLYLKN